MDIREFIETFIVEEENIGLQKLIERNTTNGLGFSRSWVEICKNNYPGDNTLKHFGPGIDLKKGIVNEEYFQFSLSFMDARISPPITAFYPD